MSSLIGHAATGAAIYLSHGRLNAPQARWALPLLVFLAIVPDFDYFAIWFFDIYHEPRITHSIAFCLTASALAWALTFKARANVDQLTALFAFTLASCSHLVLDLLVGAHPLPLFWPFSAGEISSPISILPAAGHFSVGSYYLWRNLFIECGILFPMLAAMVALCRMTPVRSMLLKALVLGPLWIICLGWSIMLQR